MKRIHETTKTGNDADPNDC